MKNLNAVLAFTVVSTLLFIGCNKKAPTEIEWHKGKVEAAFELAKKQKNPLFIYWGAKWCPPCNVLKSTVFPQAEVIAATQKYVSVYLDGDTQDAQIWGEKLNASSYPTLLLLNADGKEIYRASSLLDAKTFTDVLNFYAKKSEPIETLVKETLKNNKADRETWNQITDYAWDLYPGDDKTLKTPETFQALQKIAPDVITRSKLFFIEWTNRTETLDGNALPVGERKRYATKLQEALANPEVVAANIKRLGYWSTDFTKSLGDLGRADEIVTPYKIAMKHFIETKATDTHEILVALNPFVLLSQFKDKDKTISKLTEEEIRFVKEHIFAALNKIDDHQSHSHIMNAAAYLLRESQLIEDARAALLAKLADTKTPYYDMAILSYLEEKAGNNDKALEWSKKAYENAEGPATQFQWGVNYIKALIQYTPTAREHIQQEVQNFYKTHVTDETAFFGRNQMRLNQLVNAVNDWSTKQKLNLDKSVITQAQNICASTSIKSNDHASKQCSEHFAKYNI